jgi:hypothetical protein
MKNSLHFFFLILINVNITFSQVGINTDSPSVTLDVVGDVIIDNKLYLENPSSFSQIQNSKLLVQSTSLDILKYDIDASKYGPINYALFVFDELSTNGLQDYDTKIPTDDYIVTINGYYYKHPTIDDSAIFNSLISNSNIEGFQFYAYPNTSTNTWFLRGVVNNSQFQVRIGAGFANSPIDMYLNLIVYRKDFITKDKGDIVVDMGNSETITVPLPAGF